MANVVPEQNGRGGDGLPLVVPEYDVSSHAAGSSGGRSLRLHSRPRWGGILLLTALALSGCSYSHDQVVKPSGTCVQRDTDRLFGLKVQTEEYPCEKDR